MAIRIIERPVSVNGRSSRCTHALRATLDGMAPWWQTNKRLICPQSEGGLRQAATHLRFGRSHRTERNVESA
jgi:hypothetical protein